MTTTISDNRKAGWALIVGSVAGLVTMAIHPTMGTQSGHLALLSGITHALALVSVVLLFLGTCGLARVLDAPDRLAFAGLVTYGFAVLAVTIAAAVSGWIVPDILRLQANDVAANAPEWHMIVAGVFQINQAFARIYSVAGAVSILLWSACCLQLGRLSRGFAVFGCVTAPLLTLLIAAGHLRLNVHGMTVVMLSEVIWFAGMGFRLLRTSPEVIEREEDAHDRS